MKTFVLIHGAGDSAASWDLVAARLRDRGHAVVAVDLPSEVETAGLQDYTDHVVAAAGAPAHAVVVGHSLGGWTAPLVAARLAAEELVLVCAMIPRPGERALDYWAHAGYGEFESDDPFFHDVPADVRAWAETMERPERSRMMEDPWPLPAWPDVATRYVLGLRDRAFPEAITRRVVVERLGIEPEVVDAGHCPYLSRPAELTALLDPQT